MMNIIGQKCDTANNGKEAIEKIQKGCEFCEGFRLVFMDINMPELDGFETTKILKRLEKENIQFIQINKRSNEVTLKFG